jgi:hypothetical protein
MTPDEVDDVGDGPDDWNWRGRLEAFIDGVPVFEE